MTTALATPPARRTSSCDVAINNINMILAVLHIPKKEVAEASYIGKHLSRLLGDGWTPHSLRHRYATATYRATNDLFLVSKLLGHDSVETTQRYVAMPEDRLRAALDDVALVI